jgi:hypothetical protein
MTKTIARSATTALAAIGRVAPRASKGRTPRAIIPVLVVAGALAATLTCAGSASAASSVTGTVAAGSGLHVRLATSGAATDMLTAPVTATIPYGATVDIVCYWIFPGDNVTGPWRTTDVWDGIDYYVYHGTKTYVSPSDHTWDDHLVSDAWINDGGNTENMGLPTCYGWG